MELQDFRLIPIVHSNGDKNIPFLNNEIFLITF